MSGLRIPQPLSTFVFLLLGGGLAQLVALWLKLPSRTAPGWARLALVAACAGALLPAPARAQEPGPCVVPAGQSAGRGAAGDLSAAGRDGRVGAGSALAPAVPAVGVSAAVSATSLSEILRAVLARHPSFRSFQERSRASLERTRDVLQRRNPEVQGELGGSGPFDEFVGGLELVQPLRPAGEVAALRRAGEAERTTLASECLVAGANVLGEAAGSYADLIAAGDLGALAVEELEVARGFETHARRRLQLAMGGDLPVLQSEILVAEALARREEAAGRAAAARARLQALLGRPPGEAPVLLAETSGTAAREEWARLVSLPPDLGDLAGAAAPTLAPAGPELAAAADSAIGAPALRAARARAEAARIEVDVVRVQRRPTPHVGLRAERDTRGEFKLFFLAGLALPIFNRPQHAVRAAEAQAQAARWEVAADSLKVVEDLAGRLADYAVARRALEQLEAETLPRAERLEAAARANAEQGAAGFVLWLEARRSYLDLRHRQIDLRREAAGAALELRRVTGDFAGLLEES